MANQSLAGTPLPRNSAPLVTRGVPNANGLYPWSAFLAFIYDQDQQTGLWSWVPLRLGDVAISTLLFTSDYPIFALSTLYPEQPLYFKGVTEVPSTPFSGVPPFNSSEFLALVKEPNGTSPVPLTPGTVGIGYKYQSTVPLCGYAVQFPLPAYGLKSAEDPDAENAPVKITLAVVANGAVVSGPETFLRQTAPVPGPKVFSALEIPIIIPVVAYTQAILDNGNVIEQNGTRYSVVGVWYSDSK